MGPQRLDSKATWMFAFSALWSGFSFIIIIIFYAIVTFEKFDLVGPLLGAGALFALVISSILAWMYGALSRRFYLYELRDDGFRKESGIIWKRYTTIPYERIQNVDISRGIIARILGLSDLHIQTAGSSGGYYGGWGMRGAMAEGRLPGIAKDVAEKLRDELIRRAKVARASGL